MSTGASSPSPRCAGLRGALAPLPSTRQLRRSTHRLRRAGWLVFQTGLLGSLACQKTAHTLEPEGKLARARCASACASLNRCTREDLLVQRQAQCVEQCESSRADATLSGCLRAQDRALECTSTAPIACERLTSTRRALEQGDGVDGCQSRFEKLARCSAPCREAGVVRSSTRRLAVSGNPLDVAAELTSLGCSPPKVELARKAPSGSPCQHFSVCTPARCLCPGSNATYAARVCADGRCAAPAQACELAPRSVRYDACQGR